MRRSARPTSPRVGHSLPFHARFGSPPEAESWTNGFGGTAGGATNAHPDLHVPSDGVRSYVVWCNRASGSRVLSCGDAGASENRRSWFIGTAATSNWGLNLSTNGTSYLTAINANVALGSGSWEMIVVILNNVTRKYGISANGQTIVWSSTLNSPLFPATGDPVCIGALLFGGSPSATGRFFGLIDDLRVYTREVTQGEIELLWDDGEGHPG